MQDLKPLLTAGQQPNMVSFEPILPDGNLEQPRQILQSVWSKNTWERLVLVSLGRKNDFRKPVISSPVELRLRRGQLLGCHVVLILVKIGS